MCTKGSNLVGIEEKRNDGTRSEKCDGNVPLSEDAILKYSKRF